MKKFPVIALTFSFSLTLLGLLPTSSVAQDDGVYQRSENSSITGGDADFNPFDLIHNSRLSNGRNSEQFGKDSAENIDDAAADYRNSLLLYFQQQKAKEAASEPTVVDDAVNTGIE